ncbi:MAG: hypothetical protein JWQ25_1289 [Daejeonella sp.]|nr:hypothetical protein [Daejeonella sp.]
MNKGTFAVIFASAYLLVYLVMIHSVHTTLGWAMFLFSPLIVFYMVYSVIHYGKYTGIELLENEEWGYEDKNREHFH